MTERFKDHFSDRAANYATYRPTYPPALADYLLTIASKPGTAWDVGCGSGQLSTLLGDRFERVIATDASSEQVVRAAPHPRVEYAVATAEQSSIAAASVDLIAVAQAAHWFDLPRFYEEVRRVAKPNAGFALLTYGITVVEEPVRPIVDHFYSDVLGPWWPLERRHTETGYREFDFPFDEIAAPAIEMAVTWTLNQFLGYVGTWSAVRAMETATGSARTKRFREEVSDAWGGTPTRRVWWPLGIRAGKVRVA